MKLPARDHINVGLGLTSVAGLAGFCVTGDPTLAMLSLGAGVVSSGALGLHMTASIGGADMPVVITLLNSYSGWALCAEGTTPYISDPLVSATVLTCYEFVRFHPRPTSADSGRSADRLVRSVSY